MACEILKIREHPGLRDKAAAWFHAKWGVPLDAYRESIGQCLAHRGPVPQWYVAVDGEQITGGLGVIENDFHNRKDLAPNVCGLCGGGIPLSGDRRGAAGVRLRGHGGAGGGHPVPAHRPHVLL